MAKKGTKKTWFIIEGPWPKGAATTKSKDNRPFPKA